MKTIIYKDYNELSLETALQIAQVIANKPDALLCFPAGETSVGTFNELVRLHNDGKLDFSKCRIVGLDEWVHLGDMQKENCYNFLKKHLFDHINILQENLSFFNGEAEDLQKECLIADKFIKDNGGIDMMLLGVGMNGHLGLNEPGVSFDTYSHVTELDEVTKLIGQKYFSKRIQLTHGITLGIKHIMESKTVVVQLSGSKKAPIVKRLLESDVTNEFPATAVKDHPNAFMSVDKKLEDHSQLYFT